MDGIKYINNKYKEIKTCQIKGNNSDRKEKSTDTHKEGRGTVS